MKCSVLLAGLSMIVMMGCARGPDQGAAEELPTPADAAKSSGPTLATLQTRDRKLAIIATSAGPRFTVSTSDGRVLARNLTLDQLEARDPELHDAFRSGTAQGHYIDARLDVGAPAARSQPDDRSSGR